MRSNKNNPLVIPRQSFWKRHLLCAAAAFGITAAAVYYVWSVSHKVPCGNAGSNASAVVVLWPDADQEIIPADSLDMPALTLQNVKIRVFSEEFLTKIIRDCGLDVAQANAQDGRVTASVKPDQLWQGLNIAVEPESADSGIRIVFTISLGNSPEASRLVRAMADRFTGEYKTFWAAEMRKIHIAVLDRAEQARLAKSLAIENLQSFKEGITSAKKANEEPQHQTFHSTEPDDIQNGDNPEWIEMNESLASLQQEETEMLENKTPLHPDVLDIRQRIAELKQQLAQTPRFGTSNSQNNSFNGNKLAFPDNSEASQNNEQIPIDDNSDNSIAGDRNETNEALQRLENLAVTASQVYENELQLEKQVFEAGRREPKFSIAVNSSAPVIDKRIFDARLVESMFYHGFAAVVGISVISSGASIQPVLGTIADLELLIPAPVIGVVPGKDESHDPFARKRRQKITRWSLIAVGMLILLATAGFLLSMTIC